MPKTITISQGEFDKRAKEVAQKSFLLGVDWLCKLLVDSDIYDFSQREAEMFHRSAERVIVSAVE